MKPLCFAMILILAAVAYPQRAARDTSTVDGAWKAWFVNPHDPERPHMIKEIAFDFRMDGKTLKGTAHLDVWPGDAAITDGTIEEDRISFTVVGKIASTTGFPKFKFRGTIRDNKMNLFMRSTLKSNEEVSDVEVAIEGNKRSN